MIINHPQEITASKELIFEMKQNIKFVSFQKITRLLYSTDASIYQMMPVGVVFPRNPDEISTAISIAGKYKIPILPRGGGSSLAGQAIGHAIILDLSRYMDKILEINPQKSEVIVEPGITLSRLNNKLRQFGLMYGPDPASEDRATIGGIIGNNSTGSHSIVYGMTSDHVRSVEIILADANKIKLGKTALQYAHSQSCDGIGANIFNKLPILLDYYSDSISKNYPKTFRHVSGYNLNLLINKNEPNFASLIVGSEGTLGVISQATLNLVKIPKKKCLALVHFNSLSEALDAVPELLETNPSAVEMIDKMMLELIKNKSEYKNLLNFVIGDPEVLHIVEYSGNSEKDIDHGLNDLAGILRNFNHKGHVVIIKDEQEQANIWHARKVGLGILMSIKGDAKPIPVIEDAAVPVKHLKSYIMNINAHAKEIGIKNVAMYAHASAGCIHVKPFINLKTENGIKHLRSMAEKSVELVKKYDGTNSGEHGDGILRGEFLENLFGSKIMEAFVEVKNIFDPGNLMNPGKIINTPRMDDESLLRYGSNYIFDQSYGDTIFKFEKFGGFQEAIEICNGAGVCRKLDLGVMCPSFQALRDEDQSTRGRANVLRLALTGQMGPNGFYSKEVYEIMSFCLACQACKSECPSSVDMAKIKSEYLYQYQKVKGVPIASWFFVNIANLYKIAQKFSTLSNYFIRGPGKLFFNLLSIHPDRNLPLIAKQTFLQWFFKRDNKKYKKKVVFLQDTFLEFNHPELGKAAIKILENAGYEPIVLKELKSLGRPAVSKGLLKEAKILATHNVDLLFPYVENGIPIIGVEPSSITMISDEYPDLIPGEKSIILSKKIMSFEEFIVVENDKELIDFKFINKHQKILFHGHCQQKANYGTLNTIKFLELIPKCEVSEIDSGCCGMAGTFGYEKKNYDLSIAIAEQRLAPAIRDANIETIICATGVSCREQIDHTTDRTAVHPIMIFANSIIELANM